MPRKPEIAAAEARIVREVLAEILPAGWTVLVFGSRATGRAHRGSDLDLALEGPAAPLPAVTLSRLKDAFTESRLPYRVDLVDLGAVGEDFRSRVRRQAIPFSLGPFSPGTVSRRV
ncbi:MAG: nucleotidyltransferase domain-containing protein [Rhodospirillales bacterium]|nr:nucleotidyltransferase domain-containing protein [Rhodospirillales bacterium]